MTGKVWNSEKNDYYNEKGNNILGLNLELFVKS